ncbi:MAG: hypothetical protein KDD35_07160 [Bdellovibrionales bacterium]|nr:hypothetical protein [Bdellovibrionales bacterium]
MKWILVALLSAVSLGWALAEPQIEVDAIRERAKSRFYPGGRDEEDLKVQINLTDPLRKIDIKSVQAEILKITIQSEEEAQEE